MKKQTTLLAKKNFTLLSLTALLAAMFSVDTVVFGQGGLWQPAGQDALFTNRSVGIKTNSPTKDFEVNGSFRSRTAMVDSILSSWQVMVSDALLVGGNLSVSGNAAITGTFTAGQILIDGNSITSSGGSIIFPGNDLSKINNLYTNNIESGSINSTMYLLNGALIDFNAIDSNIISLQSAINDMPPSPWVSADTGIVYVDNGGSNFANASYSTITGGQSNTIDPLATYGVISGGQNNYIHNAPTPTFGHSHSFIGGGQNNSIQSSSGFSVIAGGSGNIAGGPYSVVAGGENNQSTGSHSGIFSGTGNNVALRASHSVIAGGNNNAIQNAAGFVQEYNLIGNGSNNIIEHNTSNATILNGSSNLIQQGANHSVILNGSNITASQPNTAYTPNIEIQGGLARYDAERHSLYDSLTLVDKGYVDNANNVQQQQIDSIQANLSSGLAFSTGAGQYSALNNQSGTNAANANYSFIGAGHNNLIDSNAQYGAIVAGSSNIIHNDGFPVNSHRFNFIGNGVGNYTEASVNNSSVLNGLNNSIKTGANVATVVGGENNSVSGIYSSVGGGKNNNVQSTYSLIAGGQNNTIQPTAHYSAILSGTNNQIQNAPIGPIQQKNVITGGENNIIQSAVSNATVVGGSGNTIQSGANRAVILGGSGITAKTTDAVYVTQLAMNEQGAGFDGILQKATLTSDKSWTLPDKSGMIALVSDISETSLSLSGDTMGGNITMASGTSLTHSTSNGKLTFDALGFTNAIGIGYNISSPLASSKGIVIASPGSAGYPGGFIAAGYNASSTKGQGLAIVPAGHPTYPDGIVSLHDGNADGTVHIGTGDVTIGQRINLNGIDKKIRIENDGGDKIILEGINNPSLWETTQGISIAPKAGVTLAGPVMTIEGEVNVINTLKIGQNSVIIQSLGNINDPDNNIYSDNGDLLIQNKNSLNYNTIFNSNNTGNVGIGTTQPTEKLDVSGNIKSSALAGTGTRLVTADASGVLTTQPISGSNNPYWSATGNSGTGADNFIGTTDESDLVIKTNDEERIRVTSTGEHPGLVGVGTSSPEKAFHVKTEHLFTEPIAPACANPFSPPSGTICFGGESGSHNGIRLEDVTTFGGGTSFHSEWDLVPAFGSFVIGKPDVNDPEYNDLIGTRPMLMVDPAGRVGIGASPKEKFQIGNSFTFHDGGSKAIARNFYFDGQDKRIEEGKAAAIYFSDQGTLGFRVAPGGAADEQIAWINALTIENNGNTSLNEHDLLLRNTHHGLGWYGTARPFVFEADGVTPVNIDGPVLYGWSGGALGAYNGNGKNLALRWTGDGMVGIGTDMPQARLDVIGTIRACEVRVNLESGQCPPDFVFESGYKLLALKKRKEIILKNKHLPHIKAGKEIEDNGLDVSGFSFGLLQNVEEHELFLYEHDEKIEKFLHENEELKAEISELKKAVEQLIATNKK